MNYILTADEIRTLAAMLGAKRLVGLARQSASFSREAAVVSVLRLTQRGILKSTEEGLTCQKQVRSLMAVVAAPQQCVLVTDVTLAQSQLICYCSGTSAVVAGEILERPGEYRLRLLPESALLAYLREEGYLPRRDITSAEAPSAPIEAGNKTVDLYSLALTTTVLERLDPVTAQCLNRVAIVGHEGAETIRDRQGESVPYRMEELARRLFARKEEQI